MSTVEHELRAKIVRSGPFLVLQSPHLLGNICQLHFAANLSSMSMHKELIILCAPSSILVMHKFQFNSLPTQRPVHLRILFVGVESEKTNFTVRIYNFGRIFFFFHPVRMFP